MKRKILSMLLAVIMVIGILPTMALATGEAGGAASNVEYEHLIIKEGYDSDVVANGTDAAEWLKTAPMDKPDASLEAHDVDAAVLYDSTFATKFFSMNAGETITGSFKRVSDGAFTADEEYYTSDQLMDMCLPDDHIVVSENAATPGLSWKLADYSQNNAVRVPQGETRDITFAKRGVYQKLYFLTVGGSVSGEGGMTVTVTYSDGTTDERAFDLYDWYNFNEQVASSGFARLEKRSYNLNIGKMENRGPNLHQSVMPVDTTKVITKVSVENNDSNDNCQINIFAVTGATGDIAAPTITLSGNELSWAAVAGAEQYTLDIGEDEDFQELVADHNNKIIGAVTTYDVSQFAGKYFRVRAVDADGASSASSNVVWGDSITAHDHSFQYTAQGDTLTAVCSADECPLADMTATIRLTAGNTTYVPDTPYSDASLPASIGDVSLGTITYTYKDMNADDSAYSNTAPTNAGEYTVKATFTIDSTTYELTSSFQINKVEYVSAPMEPDPISITENSVELRAVVVTGEQVEYAKSMTAAAPTSDEDWQDSLVFGGLDAATAYYFFSRVKASDNYTAGPASDFVKVWTLPDAPLASAVTIDYVNETLSFDSDVYEMNSAPDGSGNVIHTGDNISGYITDLFGTNVYVRVKESNDIAASPWTLVSIPPRMREPTMEHYTKNLETIVNKKNASLEIPARFYSAFEYRIEDDTNWTLCLDEPIANPENKTIELRFRATENSFAGVPTFLTFAGSNTTLTYTFDSMGGEPVPDIEGLAYGDSLDYPTDPTRDGYVFAGWYLDEACTRFYMSTRGALDNARLGIAGKSETDSVTLYAKWVAEDADVTQFYTFVADGNTRIPGALVELRRGNEVIASTVTDSDGQFSFGGIEDGIYNLVVTDPMGKVKTMLYDTEAGIPSIQLPNDGTSSVIAVRPDSPDVMAGGLDALSENNAETGKLIRIEFVVDAATIDDDEKSAINSVAGSKKVLEFLNLDIKKYINDLSPEQIEDTMVVLEIIVPFQTAGRSGITVYRHHEGVSTAFTELATRPTGSFEDGTYFVGDGFVVIYSRYFSAYAIGYTNPSGGSSGHTTRKYTLSFDINGGSSIASISKTKGTIVDLASYNPTRDGFDFTGWYSDAALTNRITSIVLSGNKTVYAGWKAIEAAPDPEPVAWVNPFVDVSEQDWFYDGVRFANENNLMKGTSSNTFSPDTTTTRGMIVTILYRLEKEPAVSGACPFDDVKPGSYYADAITWAAANGIVMGYDNGRFAPEDSITREQMATILYRYADYKDYDLSAGENTNILSYEDASDISSYAITAIQWACGEGLVNGMGDGTLAPQGEASRAQIASILYRFIKDLAE